jgi:hypothetical protein
MKGLLLLCVGLMGFGGGWLANNRTAPTPQSDYTQKIRTVYYDSEKDTVTKDYEPKIVLVNGQEVFRSGSVSKEVGRVFIFDGGRVRITAVEVP